MLHLDGRDPKSDPWLPMCQKATLPTQLSSAADLLRLAKLLRDSGRHLHPCESTILKCLSHPILFGVYSIFHFVFGTCFRLRLQLETEQHHSPHGPPHSQHPEETQ